MLRAGSAMPRAGSSMPRAGSSMLSAACVMLPAASSMMRAGSSMMRAGSSMMRAASSMPPAGQADQPPGSGEELAQKRGSETIESHAAPSVEKAQRDRDGANATPCEGSAAQAAFGRTPFKTTPRGDGRAAEADRRRRCAESASCRYHVRLCSAHTRGEDRAARPPTPRHGAALSRRHPANDRGRHLRVGGRCVDPRER